MMPEIKNRIKNESGVVKKAARDKIFGYIATALGLVAGLAWNAAITGLIDTYFPAKGNSIIAKFVYAIILTIIIVIVLVYMERFLSRNNGENTK